METPEGNDDPPEAEQNGSKKLAGLLAGIKA